MLHLMEPALFNAQLGRTLGTCAYQGAEIGECLAIAAQVMPGDKESWYTTWTLFANRAYEMGEKLASKALFTDAKSAFLRASNYYRTGFFFLEDNPEDSRIELALQKSTNAFLKASCYFEVSPKNIAIPFENTAILGYLYLKPSQNNAKKPILIDTGGGDGTKEESYFGPVVEALRHDMHCISIEGPGQGSVLRLNKTPFIPDWERVIEQVVNFVSQLPDVDPEKIYLLGRSFGGYLAARAVTQEKRIAACIVDPGILDPLGSIQEKVNKLKKTAYKHLEHAPAYQVLEKAMENDTNLRFMLNSRIWRFGAKSIQELLEITQQFTMQARIEHITCPMLVCDNTLEYLTPGQAQQLYNALNCKKSYLLFKEEQGEGGHCQALSSQLFFAKIYTWLKDL